MKKMFVIAGVLAAIAGVATAVCRSRKNMHRCEQMTRRNSE